jgi:hypothetical protein
MKLKEGKHYQLLKVLAIYSFMSYIWQNQFIPLLRIRIYQDKLNRNSAEGNRYWRIYHLGVVVVVVVAVAILSHSTGLLSP